MRKETIMAEVGSAHQTDGKKIKVQAVEAGMGGLKVYRDAVWMCTDRVRKTKVRMELGKGCEK